MVHLYLVRHGQQNCRLCNVDVSLSEKGQKQAQLVADRLAGYNGIDGLYCSDLHRAIETGQIIGQKLNMEPVVMAAFKEIDFGELTGRSDEEIAQLYGDFKARLALMKEDLPYPGGENARDVYNRMMPALRELARSGRQKMVIVSHGGAIRAVLSGMFGDCFAHRYQFGKTMENCSITELLYDEAYDRFILERFNDYGHLEGHEALMRENW